jgi:hypothetical protein
MRGIASIAALCIVLAGCKTPPPRLSPEQLEALETRELDGNRDDVLRAAAAVLLDKGFFYVASDGDAGLITAVQGFNAETLSVWVRQVAPGRAQVRLQARAYAYEPYRVANQAFVTKFWASVQRRMLGGEAAPQSEAAIANSAASTAGGR